MKSEEMGRVSPLFVSLIFFFFFSVSLAELHIIN